MDQSEALKKLAKRIQYNFGKPGYECPKCHEELFEGEHELIPTETKYYRVVKKVEPSMFNFFKQNDSVVYYYQEEVLVCYNCGKTIRRHRCISRLWPFSGLNNEWVDGKFVDDDAIVLSLDDLKRITKENREEVIL